MPHTAWKGAREGARKPGTPGNYDSRSLQKPLKEQQMSSNPPQEHVGDLRETKSKKRPRQPRPKPLFFPPWPQGTMSVASDTSAETLEGSLASYPPQYKHEAFDFQQKEHQGKALWKNPTGWDLRVICGSGKWLVHRDIIKEEAPGFYDVVLGMATPGSTQEGGRDILTLNLSSWGFHPGTIGGLLMFLYTRDWPDMDGHPPGPTNLRSVRYYIDVAVQAWNLYFPTSVRAAAVFKINRATYQLHNLIVGKLSDYPLCREGYAGIEQPLYMSLEFLYDQEDPETVRYLLPIRAALARLVAIAVPWLLKQDGFVHRFVTLWSREPMYDRYIGDHHKFSQLGCLLPSWNDPPEKRKP